VFDPITDLAVRQKKQLAPDSEVPYGPLRPPLGRRLNERGPFRVHQHAHARRKAGARS